MAQSLGHSKGLPETKKLVLGSGTHNSPMKSQHCDLTQSLTLSQHLLLKKVDTETEKHKIAMTGTR